MFTSVPTTYAVYDLETTGLNPEGGDEAIEIGVVIVDDNKIISSSSILVKPSKPITPEITKITGITQEMVDKEGIEAKLAWKEFISLTRGIQTFIGHNITKFDNRFVHAAMKRHEIIDQVGLNDCIDTAALYKGHKLGQLQKWNETHMQFADRILEIRAPGVTFKLTEAFAKHGGDLNSITAHRALADCKMTNFIYRKMAGLPPVYEEVSPKVA